MTPLRQRLVEDLKIRRFALVPPRVRTGRMQIVLLVHASAAARLSTPRAEDSS